MQFFKQVDVNVDVERKMAISRNLIDYSFKIKPIITFTKLYGEKIVPKFWKGKAKNVEIINAQKNQSSDFKFISYESISSVVRILTSQAVKSQLRANVN